MHQPAPSTVYKIDKSPNLREVDAITTASEAAVHAVVPKAVRGRRPKPLEVNLEQQLGTRHLLEIVNIESNA